MVVPNTLLLLMILVTSTASGVARISAPLYDAGFQHGRLARKSSFQSFKRCDFFEFGKTADRLIKYSSRKLGKSVRSHSIWINFSDRNRVAHESRDGKIFTARREDEAVSHGHNEDWSATFYVLYFSDGVARLKFFQLRWNGVSWDHECLQRQECPWVY